MNSGTYRFSPKAMSSALIIALILSMGAAYVARGDSPAQIYYACVNNSSGTIKMVSADQNCHANELRITWNSQGPEGPQGPQGPAGDEAQVEALEEQIEELEEQIEFLTGQLTTLAERTTALETAITMLHVSDWNNTHNFPHVLGKISSLELRVMCLEDPDAWECWN